MSDVKRFSFAFAPSYRTPARFFGITPAKARVDVDDSTLDARFGPWGLTTPLQNIAEVEVTGPYSYPKTAGPAHLGITDRGLTFASNGDCGVLITFKAPVRSHGPTAFLRHPELTVTVADVYGLAELLRGSIS